MQKFEILRFCSVPPDLMRKLSSISKVYDFSEVILNNEVGVLKAGMQFGDLALNSDVRRQASIKTNGFTVLAYLKRLDY